MRVLAFPLLLTVACADYPFVFQTNQRVATRRYEIEIQTEGRTDVLFVIDNSGSMAEEQEKLKENIQFFIDVLTRSVNDYQVGIVSTDIFRNPDPSCTPCCDQDTDGDGVPDWSTCDAGRLIAADGRRRLFRRPRGDSLEQVEELTEQLIVDFNDTVTSIGTEGNATEAAFEAVRLALDPEGDVVTRALNFGFLRSNADLTLIFLSDEDDCSAPSEFYSAADRDDSDCYTTGELDGVSDFLDFLVDLKGTVRRVRAAAIVGSVEAPDSPLGYAASGCFTDPAQEEPSNTCGCWSARFLPDRRDGATGEFYCNYLSETPFNQTAERTPLNEFNQGGCIALPGNRYLQFLEELQDRRVAAGFLPGVDVDSICRADYSQTLERIAVTTVVSNCFELVEPPVFVDERLILRVNGNDLPLVQAGSFDPGWSYNAASQEICLEGGLVKEVGDIYELVVPTEEPRQ
ncbi:MAG: vWA domain-containing protein [Myxococcota bacterium]